MSSFIMKMIFFTIKTYKLDLNGLDQSHFNSFFKTFPTLSKHLHLIASWIKIVHKMISLQILMNSFSQIRLKSQSFLLPITNFISSILKIKMYSIRRIMMELFQLVELTLILPIRIPCFKQISRNLNW